MTEAEFNYLIRELQRGNNDALRLLQPFQGHCQQTLLIKSRNACSIEESYDLFVDAVLDFRKNVLQKKVKYKSVRAYLAQIVWNKWMERYRNRQRQLSKRLNVEKEWYGDGTTQSPEKKLLQKEEGEAGRQFRQEQLNLIRQAMESLSEKCRQILQMAIVDEIPMSTIAQNLGLANANVAKTTKSRCYKQLVQKVKMNAL